MDVFNAMKLNDIVEAGDLPVTIAGQKYSLPIGTVIRYKKRKNLRTYVGKVLAYDCTRAMQLKVEAYLDIGMTVTHHAVEDITEIIIGEPLHEAIRTTRRINEQYRN